MPPTLRRWRRPVWRGRRWFGWALLLVWLLRGRTGRLSVPLFRGPVFIQNTFLIQLCLPARWSPSILIGFRRNVLFLRFWVFPSIFRPRLFRLKLLFAFQVATLNRRGWVFLTMILVKRMIFLVLLKIRRVVLISMISLMIFGLVFLLLSVTLLRGLLRFVNIVRWKCLRCPPLNIRVLRQLVTLTIRFRKRLRLISVPRRRRLTLVMTVSCFSFLKWAPPRRLTFVK